MLRSALEGNAGVCLRARGRFERGGGRKGEGWECAGVR